MTENERYDKCVERFEALEKKVFNGFDTKIDAIKDRTELNSKLIILILGGVVLSIAIPIAKLFILGQ